MMSDYDEILACQGGSSVADTYDTRKEPGADIVGEPLKLGHFEVRRCGTGWVVNTRPWSDARRSGLEPWGDMHAFTTWDDMIRWITRQPRHADEPLPTDDVPF